MKDICVIDRLKGFQDVPICFYETSIYALMGDKWKKVRYINDIKFTDDILLHFSCKLFEDMFTHDTVLDNNYEFLGMKISKNISAYDSIFVKDKEMKIRLCFADDRNLMKEINKDDYINIYKEIKELTIIPQKVEKSCDDCDNNKLWIETVYVKITNIVDIDNKSL